MGYLVNIKTGCIHDASLPHVKRCIGNHYERVDTISEAKAKAIKNGKKPFACKRCGFNDATQNDCKL